MFVKSRWRSERMGKEATLARWGTYGQPVLVFPTAGGDAEEIERWQMLKVLDPLVSAGKVKIYSCDSVGGQVWFSKEGTPAHRMWMQNQFHQYIKHEVVPAIHRDCGGEVPIWTTGASIGAFHAVAVTCRFPNLFSRALGMSGTYNIMRFIEVDRYTDDYFVSSPLQFVPTLEGPHLERLKKNFILFASGAGRAENMGETWDMANVLGKKGIPNRVDPWGADVHHDWMTWRVMLPKYLGEWLAETKTGRSTP
jgi:esterase/lipase superfamily enzyme